MKLMLWCDGCANSTNHFNAVHVDHFWISQPWAYKILLLTFLADVLKKYDNALEAERVVVTCTDDDSEIHSKVYMHTKKIPTNHNWHTTGCHFAISPSRNPKHVLDNLPNILIRKAWIFFCNVTIYNTLYNSNSLPWVLKHKTQHNSWNFPHRHFEPSGHHSTQYNHYQPLTLHRLSAHNIRFE